MSDVYRLYDDSAAGRPTVQEKEICRHRFLAKVMVVTLRDFTE